MKGDLPITSGSVRLLGMLLPVLLGVGCVSEVQLRPISDSTWFQRENRTALESTEPSERTLQFLRREDLADRMFRAPVELLEELHGRLLERRERELAFYLAELSYVVASKRYEEEAVYYYISSIVYAYTFLFDAGLGAPASEYDPSFRWACDLYNRSLGRVIRHRQTLEPEQRDPVFPWIGGELYVTQGANEYKFDLNDYEEIKVAFNYDVKGLGGLARSYGLGVPLILVRSQLPQGQEFHPRILKMLGSGPSEALEMKSSYAASVLVKLDSSFVARSGSSAPMSMTFEVFDPSRTSQIEIGQRCVPLEADLSSPLAYSLGASAGYSGLGALFNPGENQGAAGLFLLQPYDAEKIPVIFVHGLMSAPITWVALINDLLADPELRQRCQFWFFRYPTGNPVLLSASLLRDTLGEAYRVLDPSDSHPAMDHMVICGHSMGGLLTRMQLLDGGDRIWTRISETPLDSLGLEEDQKQLLQHIFYFEQVPFLTRAVFLATPHRGADMANSFVGSLGRWLITLPNRVLQVTVDLGRELGDRLRNPLGRRLQEEGSSGITSLAPDSFLATTISEFPLPADVAVHSILGDEHEAGRIGGSDGLVDYESSHVEGVQSELVLESGHNVQKHPLAAVELRRILHLHLDEYDAALAAAHRVLEEPPTTSSAASVAEPEIPK